MSFASLHKRVTYVMAGLGLLTLFLGGELTAPIQALIATAFFVSFFADGHRIERSGWQLGWNVVLLSILAIEMLRGVFGDPLLPLALEFTSALQISRLFNRRTAAEHRQIAMLAFLQLCAATVLSTELAYGIAFFGFVVVTPWMLALTHLRGEIETNAPGESAANRAEHARQMLASERVVGLSFLLGTAALSVPLFALTAILFVAFPRVGLGLISFGRGTPTHVSGFGGDVELGQVGLVRDDPRVVLRVEPPGLPLNPPIRASIRMRGTSFDHYDGRRWTRSLRDAASIGRTDSLYRLIREPDFTRDSMVSIVLDHLDEPVVFLPDRTVAIEIPPRVQSGVEIGRRILIEPGLDIRYNDDDAVGLRYRAWVAPDTRDAARERLSAEMASYYLQVPEGHERIRALAAEWTRGAASDRERAEMILTELRNFDYSLEMRDPGSRPPLLPFLLDWQAGHCEYFSSAMAIMLRTLGVPTRNVTGFLGGRWNEWGRWYSLTNGDAHSWVEVWLEGEGWVTFDPTPPSRANIALTTGLIADLTAMIDAIRTRWEEDIVSYDLRAQRSLARSLATWFRGLGRERDTESELPPSGSELQRNEPASPWPRTVLILAALVAGPLGLRMLIRRRRNRRGHHVSIPETAREVVAVYHALERALSARNRARPPGRTPREHADWLRQEGYAHAAEVDEITTRYLEVRYGGARLDENEARTLWQKVREIERRA